MAHGNVLCLNSYRLVIVLLLVSQSRQWWPMLSWPTTAVVNNVISKTVSLKTIHKLNWLPKQISQECFHVLFSLSLYSNFYTQSNAG
jgi:hypothetical protein